MQRDDFRVRTFPALDAVGVSGTAERLRVLIATEEILGPVRNGGIASTYYHLARGLAGQGHEVHVLFLKGPVVQDETPDHWVSHFAAFGVRLHYLEMTDVPLWGVAPTWQRRYAAAYEWLRDAEPFDVVHTSEWRGGLVYALMAKRLGLAFRDTLFIVKTSSPYVWNRHYQMQPMAQRDLIAAAYAEQKCVELADVVVGGSAHLISFMDRIGYRLPEANVYVQPNIVDFSHVTVEDRRPGPRREPGDLVRTRDLVFFGRLEARKGIQLFCNAVDVLHERGEVPDSITFLGKWGARLATQGGMSPEDFVNEKAHTWSCPVQVVTDRNQPEALSFLCQRDVVAVMPSLIENSTMAVYETLEQRIPFIATTVGGTPELIHEADHGSCLVEPTAQALADRMSEVLQRGQRVARPAFSNDENLDVWYGFHAHVGGLIREHGREGGISRVASRVDRPGPAVATISLVALARRGEDLDALLKALHEATPDEVVLGFHESSARREVEELRDSLADISTRITVVNCVGDTAGTALNRLVETQSCDAFTVADGVGALPRAGFYEAARRGLDARPGTLFTTFFVTDDDATLGMPLGGDVASQVLTSRAYGPEIVALTRDTYAELGAFEPYDARHGIVHEYVTRASTAGHDLLVLPEQLISWRSAVDDARALHGDPTYSYLKAKPLIDRSDLAQRKVLLAALHPAGSADVDERFFRPDAIDAADMHWLMPATWDSEDVSAAEGRRVVIGLDAARNELWLYARGPGERRLSVRGEPEPIELIASQGDVGTDDHVTLSAFRVPETWEAGTSYPLIWGIYDGAEKVRNLFLRVNKIGRSTHVFAGRNPVLSARALRDLVDRHPLTWPDPPVAGPDAEPTADETALVEESDSTDDYVAKAVAAARAFVRDRRAWDHDEVVARSRALLMSPPGQRLLPVNPRSGLKAPHRANGWMAGEWLEGWAWDREDRERTLHVAVLRDDELLHLAAADVRDDSLSRDVPGRGEHGFRIPVLSELLEGEGLRLEIWEGSTTVYRGLLYVDREGAPMLRRVRESRRVGDDTKGGGRRWWRRR